MSAYKTKSQPDKAQLKPCKVKPYNEVEAELIKLRKLETDLECQMQANQYVVDAYNKQFDKIDKKFQTDVNYFESLKELRKTEGNALRKKEDAMKQYS